MNTTTLEKPQTQPRLNYPKAAPATLQAMLALSEVVKQGGLEKSLLYLVETRASQINGCAFCMLETLGPVERAVFLLREAFDYDYAEIAPIVGKREAACRQMVSRAKRHFAQREPAKTAPSPKAERIVQRFMGACATGNVSELLAVLTDDAVLYADGGGRVRSVLRPIRSAEHISRFFAGIHRRFPSRAPFVITRVNGEVGTVTRRADGHLSVSAFAFDGDRIRAIYTVSNPEKLRHVSGTKAGGWRLS